MRRLPWQPWPAAILYNFYAADGSELQNGDEVYVLTNPIEEALQRIDYFHGKHQGFGPIAQTYEDEDDIFAFEMFAIYRKGK